jgi:CubicO group peptidase (beta-lactamase class C family)
MKKNITKSKFGYMILLFWTIIVLIPPTVEINAQSVNIENLDSYTEKSMGEWQVPGLAIAIVKGDKVIYNKGFGVRDTDKEDPVDTKTMFAIASNTKAFTVHA